MKAKISVVIPCYNVAEYISQCMDSLEAQTIGIENLELIFVDDASTDGGKTWEKIASFEKKHPEQVIAVHLEENMCQGGARNVGLGYAHAEYIGFVDSDDWVEPDMYEALYDAIRQMDCDIVDCRHVINALDGKQYERYEVENRMDAFEKSVAEGGSHWISVFSEGEYGGGIFTGLYRRELIFDHQIFFPEHLKYEDNYWGSVIKLYARSVYHLGKNLYHYRVSSTSTLRKRNQAHHLDRLQIEELKLQKYKELGLFTRFYQEIERDFLVMYYCFTLYILWDKFEEPPYEAFCDMNRRVKELFPDYRDNKYLAAPEHNFDRLLLGLIDRNLNKQQFWAVGREVLKELKEGS